MKICVTAEDADLHALVSEDFGHAAFFVIYDTETGSWEAYPNTAPEAGTGTGIVAAERIIELGAQVVLTSYVGPHGERKLRSANIKIVQDEDGAVWSAIQRYLKKHPECKTAATSAKTIPPE
ncbi:MAG: dinitrogenase iron-molybdenum cofactor biosynthesis protein [Euryarchaeota archaeon]|nr:dinitrogenase iron-molybdenum cofactor biosynthesis protein [Euryarchaeota archaeon]